MLTRWSDPGSRAPAPDRLTIPVWMGTTGSRRLPSALAASARYGPGRNRGASDERGSGCYIGAALPHPEFASHQHRTWLGKTLYQSILLNLLLAIFNMLPIPPLDGSRIALSVMPGGLAQPYARLEKFGLLIVLGLVFVLPMIGRELGVDLNLFRWLVGTPLARILPTFESIADCSVRNRATLRAREPPERIT